MPQNKNNNQLRGWPGYRTRENKSGLDYIDSTAEAAHMEGVFYRNLFTLRLRTRKPFYLILMFLFGVLPFIGAIMLTWTVYNESRAWVILILPTLVTFPLTINFVLSILEIAGLIVPIKSKQSAQQARKEKKKKLPKRRKDFR